MTRSVDVVLALVAYFSGRGPDVDLHRLPLAVLDQATLQLALLVRHHLGNTREDRLTELGHLSLSLQLSELEHPEAVSAALALVTAVLASPDEEYREALRILCALPPGTVEQVARRLAWLAYGLLGEDDAERAQRLASVSLMLQMVQLGDGG